MPQAGASPSQKGLRAKPTNLARQPFRLAPQAFSAAAKPSHLARHSLFVAHLKRGETGLGRPLARPLGGTEQRRGEVGARQRASII
jgi:hypothetical protein